MFRSSSSTLGPRMKSWESITSWTTGTRSVLIWAYCALRSSKGTVMRSAIEILRVRSGVERLGPPAGDEVAQGPDQGDLSLPARLPAELRAVAGQEGDGGLRPLGRDGSGRDRPG